MPNTSWYFQYRRHDFNAWRVWRTDWAGDEFEILSDGELSTLKSAAARFVRFEDVTGDD